MKEDRIDLIMSAISARIGQVRKEAYDEGYAAGSHDLARLEARLAALGIELPDEQEQAAAAIETTAEPTNGGAAPEDDAEENGSDLPQVQADKIEPGLTVKQQEALDYLRENPAGISIPAANNARHAIGWRFRELAKYGYAKRLAPGSPLYIAKPLGGGAGW